MKNFKITVFGCEKDEEWVLRELAPHFDVEPEIFRGSAHCDELRDLGNRCVSIGHKTRLTKEALAALHKAGVRYVSTRSIGLDHIDTGTARSLGIAVGNVAYSPDGVADFTLMLMLMAIRNAKETIKNADNFDYRPSAIRGKELRDLTVGVVGAGRIGMAVIKRLYGFGCRVLIHDRNGKADSVPLRELLEKSDIVTLHLPLNSSTRHLLAREAFEAMKQGAFLINTARGALVDTAELVSALERKKLGGAALDVLEGEEGVFYTDASAEKIANSHLARLQQMPNVIITPHTAYYTDRVLYDTAFETLRNCVNFERSTDG